MGGGITKVIPDAELHFLKCLRLSIRTFQNVGRQLVDRQDLSWACWSHCLMSVAQGMPQAYPAGQSQPEEPALLQGPTGVLRYGPG
jgi:hypothetical protein